MRTSVTERLGIEHPVRRTAADAEAVLAALA